MKSCKSLNEQNWQSAKYASYLRFMCFRLYYFWPSQTHSNFLQLRQMFLRLCILHTATVNGKATLIGIAGRHVSSNDYKNTLSKRDHLRWISLDNHSLNILHGKNTVGLYSKPLYESCKHFRVYCGTNVWNNSQLQHRMHSLFHHWLLKCFMRMYCRFTI